MVTNEKDVPHDALVRHSLVTVLLLRALRTTTYYKDSGKQFLSKGPLTKEELVVGQLLYKLRMIKDMNAHPIWGVIADNGQIENIGCCEYVIDSRLLFNLQEEDFTQQLQVTSTAPATQTQSGSI